MKAILCQNWCPPEGLTLAEVPSPRPGAGEVHIAVHACGLNFADTLLIAGKYQVRPPLPFSPGLEVAGEVLEVGEGVNHLRVGERVAAICYYGGCAEEVVAKAVLTLPLPAEMDYSAAAAFLIAYGTSHLALVHRARLKSGEVLLVHGAAGGVGLTAVEIGKLLGARVIATASTPEKLALAKAYGAEHLINYAQEDFRQRVLEITAGSGVDVVYDPVGGEVLIKSLRCLAWGGRLLVIGFASGGIPKVPTNLLLLKNISVVGAYLGSYAEQQPAFLRQTLGELLDWFRLGKLKPHVSQTYPLESTPEALSALLQRATTGRVVVKVQR